jgi:TRAP-type C4-dicarboxylate transport system permease small subunit
VISEAAVRGLLATILRALRLWEETCLAFGVLALTGLSIANVLARALFAESLASAEELSRFLMIWITFIGIGYGASRGRHVRMTALYDALPPRAQKACMLLVTFGTSGLCGWFGLLALDYVFGTARALGSVSPVLEIPKWLVFLAAPIGLFCAALQYALAGLRNLLEPEIYLSFTARDEYDDVGPTY